VRLSCFNKGNLLTYLLLVYYGILVNIMPKVYALRVIFSVIAF